VLTSASKDTPTEIIEKLNRAINAALADPKIRARLADLGGPPLIGSPADVGRLTAEEETERWGEVVKFAGIEAEWHELRQMTSPIVFASQNPAALRLQLRVRERTRSRGKAFCAEQSK
jgi:hypothetical protein